MTYDLCGFRMLPGESIEDTFARLDAAAGVAPSTEAWEATVALGDRVAALVSSSLVRRDDKRSTGAVELATQTYHVLVSPLETQLSMPYWNSADDLDWGEIDAVLDLMRAAGFTILNPQNGEVVPPGHHVHRDDYSRSHDVVLPRLEELASEDGEPPRPWWRRLLGR